MTIKDPILAALDAIWRAAADTEKRGDEDGTDEAMAMAEALRIIPASANTPTLLQAIASAAADVEKRGGEDWAEVYMAQAEALHAIHRKLGELRAA